MNKASFKTPIEAKNWRLIKRLFRHTLNTSMHFSIASVSHAGEPHITPIGSLILGAPGHGFYFEAFTSKMPDNFIRNRRVCILAVNSSNWLWLKSLIIGRFSSPPGIRLHGKVGSPRKATKREIALWQRQVNSLRWTKGYKLMWANMSKVRDINFDSVELIRIGKMTRELVI